MGRIGNAMLGALLQVQRVMVHLLFKVFYGLRIRGARYIPRSGPAILAPNHQSRMDGLPIGYRVPPPVYCAVDRDYFDKPVIGPWLRAFRGVPLGEGSDRDGYRRCLEVLRAGHRLIIFPEGSLTRTGKLRKLQSGPARAALTLGVPIVPVTIVGAYEVYPRHRAVPRICGPIVVKFYSPIPCEAADRADLKRRIGEVNDQLERIMKRRLEAWRRVKARRAATSA